jgi:hypothetical protein
VSATDLLRDLGTDTLCEVIRERAKTDRIAEFTHLEDANHFMRAKGRLEYTVCVGINMPWAVRPKSEGEKERDAYWREAPL